MNVLGLSQKELGSTEANLESFKRDAGITDLTSEAQIALAGNAEYEKEECGESYSNQSSE